MATRVPAEKNMDELQVDCEVAQEIIAEYFAMSAKQLAAEKGCASPDERKIKSLEAKLKQLYSEKMQLGIDRADLINKAFTTYAKVLKDARK